MSRLAELIPQLARGYALNDDLGGLLDCLCSDTTHDCGW